MLCPVPRDHDDPASADAPHDRRQCRRVARESAATCARAFGLRRRARERDGHHHAVPLPWRRGSVRSTLARRFCAPPSICNNWARVLPVALAKGVLPSLHHPPDKRFPTVAAQDVGALAAQLLMDGKPPRHDAARGEHRKRTAGERDRRSRARLPISPAAQSPPTRCRASNGRRCSPEPVSATDTRG